MKKIILLSVLAIMLVSCGKSVTGRFMFKEAYTSMRFDKDLYDFIVKPDSKTFTVTVHHDNAPVPEGYADPEDYGHKILIKDSGAELGKYLSFPDYDKNEGAIIFYRNQSGIEFIVYCKR